MDFTFLGNSRLVIRVKHVELVPTYVEEQANRVLGYEMTSPVLSKPFGAVVNSAGKYHISKTTGFPKKSKSRKFLVPYSCILFETVFFYHLINYAYLVIDIEHSSSSSC